MAGEDNEDGINDGDNVEADEEGARNNNVGVPNQIQEGFVRENNNDNNQNQRRAERERNNDEINWPLDWDRAGEELTWERLLGLDGSLMFLEHVFWVASLNTLCILIFGKLFTCFTNKKYLRLLIFRL